MNLIYVWIWVLTVALGRPSFAATLSYASKEDHELAVAFCGDMYRSKGDVVLSERAFVLVCLEKILAGVDPTE